ncbi:M81 family metallopeptidase [soil metagenome]
MEPKKLRVGIIGLYHESNTFITESTTLENYRRSVLLIGEEIRRQYGNAHHEITGFFETLEGGGIEAVPIFFGNAMPWGRVSDETLDALWHMVEEGLEKAGPLDGVLAAPHGAAVSDSRPDMDGWWLSRLRLIVGEEIPIIVTLDPHANLSPTMVSACDALVAYRQNPHLDQRQRGVEAAGLMVRTLHGEIAPVSAGTFPPVAINIERQLSFAEPLLSMHRELEAVRAIPGILSASITFGFPYADIADLGTAFIVVADNLPELAQAQATRLSNWLVDNRELFRGELISPEEAVARIEDSPKPVGLLDMGDNMGGGAPGDSTILVRLLHEAGCYRALAYLPDPLAVQAAQAADIGSRITLDIGGKLPMTPSSPIRMEVTVISFHDGIFRETKPRHGGLTGGNMGPTAVVRSDTGLTIMLMSRRSGANASVQPFIACGLNPADFDVIVIKGVHAPVGAYAEVCPTLIRVNTPGVTTADMSLLNYENRRKPLFPFEEIAR